MATSMTDGTNAPMDVEPTNSNAVGTVDNGAMSPTAMPSAATEPSSTSAPMEMDDLSSSSAAQNLQPLGETIPTFTPESPTNSKENRKPSTKTSIPPPNINPPTSSSPHAVTIKGSNPQSPPVLTREQTTAAIGPATDEPITPPKPSTTTGPQLIITLLIHTGARHPYRIDEKYLKKRNVNVTDNNPVNMSVYTLKELIWRDWRDEWEPRPSSPSSIRLIHFGKLLDDKAHLKDGRFAVGESPHVVHMTVKPQDVVDDEDARIAKGGTRDRDGSERTPGCRCVIL